MDDKTDKSDETVNIEADNTMPYIKMGESKTGDGTIQDEVDKVENVDKVKVPARPKGPNASAIVVGLLAMILAGLVIAKEAMGFHVDWSRLGPGAIIGLGVVMLLIGAIGLVRRQDDDV